MSRSNPVVADVIAGDLARYGARRCFALLGTANFKISHAVVQAGVELISARHECNAASMADAYAKASGELTLVSVHSGPGLTNALTGIGEAAKSRTPLVVLAGDVPTGAVKNNFYIEQADMVRAVGAVPERLHTPGTAREDALRAVSRALRERQTIVLSLPLDVAARAACLEICRRSNCRRSAGGYIPIRVQSKNSLMLWSARSARSFSAAAARSFPMPKRC